jgi:hypothetical protein
MKYQINAICNETRNQYSLYITLNDELVDDVLEFVNRDCLESAVVDCIEYMNKFNYEYEKYFLVL